SAPFEESTLAYPVHDSRLPFSEYINNCRTLIQDRRPDLQVPSSNAGLILEANTPFELYPTGSDSKKLKYGALLVHGLFDCPFSLRDIGLQLQKQGVLCRSILLPGHGTKPSDLLHISYEDWIESVRFGVESLKSEVDQIFLIGYST